MKTSEFLEAVLGDSGYYCALGVSQDKKSRKQKFYTTLTALYGAADAMDQNGLDAYFALATFADPTVEKPRGSANAVQMRSFFLDLDCGPEKDFPDQHTALSELRKFCKALGLRRPLLVNSGRGIHAYWPLVEPVPVADWKPVAEALKRACVAQGFDVDTVPIADAARVLRMPGTRNHKDNPPSSVSILGVSDPELYTLQEFADAMEEYTAVGPTVPTLAVPGVAAGLSVDDDPVMQRLMQNRVSRFKPILVKSMGGTGCAQVAHAYENQATTSEPLWRAMLSIAAFCEDKDKAAQVMSSKHPEYSWDETKAKMDGIVGPHRCDTIDSINPGVCDTCPLRGKITSPIQLGAEIDAAEGASTVVQKSTSGDIRAYKIPEYPYPYFRGKHGGVYVKDTNADGDEEDVVVYVNDLYFTQRVHDVELGECIAGRLHLPRDAVREFVIPLVKATSREDLRKALSEVGVTLMGKGWDRLMAYTHTWVDKLQATTAAADAHRQFGWVGKNFTSFVIGAREIFADRIGYNPTSSSTAALFPAFEPAGTLEGWIESANFYNRPGLEPYQFMMCQALGSVLMRFTPVHCSIYSMYSDDSGLGKTTTQRMAMTAFGDPDLLLAKSRDGLNPTMNRVELMKDLPLQFDEFTEFPIEQTSDFLYEATGGRQKNRMSGGSNQERHRGAPWHLCIGVSSNSGVMAKVHAAKAAPRAEYQRVLEHPAEVFKFADKSETDVFAKRVGQDYGHAVVPFVQYIIQNVDTVRELIDSVQRKIDKAAELTAKNRIWSVQGTVTMAALIIARELKLLDYPTAPLFDFTVDLIQRNKRTDKESTVPIESLVNDYVNDNYGNILWIKSTDDLRGAHASNINANGLDALAVPDHLPRVKFVARYETDTKKLFLVPKPLRAWCVRNRLNYDSFYEEARKKMSAKKAKVRLSKGTKLNLPPADVIVLDCAEMDLAETVDGGTQD